MESIKTKDFYTRTICLKTKSDRFSTGHVKLIAKVAQKTKHSEQNKALTALKFINSEAHILRTFAGKINQYSENLLAWTEISLNLEPVTYGHIFLPAALKGFFRALVR